jgi:hypothetical protein
MKVMLWLFFSLMVLLTRAQTMTEPKVVQLSGVVVVGDSLYPAPFVTIYRMRDFRGTYSDRNGYFTLPAMEGDTLMFYFTGLKRSIFNVPAAGEAHVSLVQVMEEDTIQLPTTYILPYPSRENFRKELLALDLPNDNYFAFNRHHADVARQDGMYNFKDEIMREAESTLTTRYTNGFKSGGNILDRKAWTNFLNRKRR